MSRHGMSQKEVAEALGISRALVQQIERKALWKLKKCGKLDAFRELCNDGWQEDVSVYKYHNDRQ